MGRKRTACVVLTQNTDGTFEVMDALGQLHRAKSMEQLSQVCVKVLEDDNLPEIETPSSAQMQVEIVAEKAAVLLASRMHHARKVITPMIPPAIRGLRKGVEKSRKANDIQDAKDMRRRIDVAKTRRDLMKIRGAS